MTPHTARRTLRHSTRHQYPQPATSPDWFAWLAITALIIAPALAMSWYVTLAAVAVAVSVWRATA